METSGTAIVAAIAAVRKHPNADRLQLAEVLGYQVVVGLDIKAGDVGIFFPEGLQLSAEYATANDLIRYKKDDGTYGGGFFDITRRVRAQKFRGSKSEGYWSPLGSLKFAGLNPDAFKVGDRYDSVNGVPLCNKYITESTRRRINSISAGNPARNNNMFKRHFETDQLRFNYDRLRSGDLLTVTLKMHGTSQRTARVLETRPLSRIQQAWNWFVRTTGCGQFAEPVRDWVYLTGSRNITLRTLPPFRAAAAKLFENKLHKGETVYYEIVGFESPNSPIMSRVKPALPELQKKYGNEVTYKYGCGDGNHDVYVYRITTTNEDGESVELSWNQVKRRCEEMGVKHTPEIWPTFVFDGNVEELKAKISAYVEDGRDPIDPSHPREGICLRLNDSKIYKHKSWEFGVLEGYIKDNPDYVDAEEAA